MLMVFIFMVFSEFYPVIEKNNKFISIMSCFEEIDMNFARLTGCDAQRQCVTL